MMKMAAAFLFFCSCASAEIGSVDRSLASSSHELILSEIVTSDTQTSRGCPEAKTGEACLMTWSEAMEFCHSNNARLPTARSRTLVRVLREILISYLSKS